MHVELSGSITTYLKNGSRGTAVKDVQVALTNAGYSTKGTDGIFGANTQTALLAFQRANGLTADGIVGPNTADALGLGWGGAATTSKATYTPPRATASATRASTATTDTSSAFTPTVTADAGSADALTAPMSSSPNWLLWGGIAVVGYFVAKKKGWI